jgi:hypothetical protein
MCDQLTALAEAYTTDADPAGPEALAQRPEWLVQCLARLIFFLLQRWLALRSPGSHRPPAWWRDRPDLPPGSAQAEAAEIRGPFGNSIAWMCLRRGIGPGHTDWPELSRAIVAFGGSLAGFRAGAPALGLQWWENPNVIPGMIGEAVATPAATATALLLSRQAVAHAPPAAPNGARAEAAHVLWPASWSPASWRQFLAPVGAGPPTTTGPPASAAWVANSVMSDARGRSTAGPAVLIRAGRTSRARPDAAYKFRPLAPIALPAAP